MSRLFSFFYNFKIRSKLALVFAATFIVSITASSAVLYTLVRKTVESNIDRELRDANASIRDLVQTAVHVSARNHLRALAETNTEIVRHLYLQSQKGLITNSEAKSRAEAILLAQVIGKTGYMFACDIRRAPGHIPFVVHPKLDGQNGADANVVQQAAKEQNGYVEYPWRNPGETVARNKATYFVYFEPWQWIIGASAYTDEVPGLTSVKDFEKQILSFRFGATGHSFIMNSRGDMIVHPELTGNYYGQKDAKGAAFIEGICKRKEGKITYWWHYPDRYGMAERVAVFAYIPELDWIVASTGSLEEFYKPLVQIKRFALFSLIISLIVGLSLISWISSHITNRLRSLMKTFETGAAGDFTVRMENETKDEIGLLARYFNLLMEKLDSYSSSLKNEIHERSAAEKQLAIFREFAENSGQPLLMTDLSGKITYVNAALCITLDEERPEAVTGTSVLSYYSEDLKQELKNKIIPTVLKQGQWLGELTVRSAKGRPTPTIQNLFLIRDDTRSPLYLASIITDISEHKKAQQALRESEEKYRSVVEESLVGVCIIQDGYLQYVNNKYCEISGYSYEELVRTIPHLELVHPDDREMVRDSINGRLRKEHCVSEFEYRRIRKDGEIIVVKALATRSIYRGRPAIIGTLLDISKEQALEHQLRQAQKMEAIGQLAGGVAHDFNNILTAVIGYANLLKIKVGQDDPVGVYVDHILSSSEKAAGLTQSLLAFSRKQLIKPEPQRVNRIVQESEKLLKRLLTEDIDLKIMLSAEDPTILCDVTQLHQVLLNLSTNARDAMPGGGTLTIRTATADAGKDFVMANGKKGSGKYALISFTDTGHGMDQRTTDQIFNPFFTTKETGKGTGLGLSIVYGVVEQHNGHIDVRSTVNKGTTFNLYFPITREDLRESLVPEIAPTEKHRGTEVILVAEDNVTVRQLTREVLEDSGYTVIEATDGLDAVQRFSENREKIDLVILDVVMPNRNGNEAYQEIQEIRHNVKVIFMSGYTGDVVLGKGIQDSAFNFISKPASPHNLLTKVRAVLDG
ncbi:MAG: Blue-light-activated protein [Syntrophorhabdus sp. PtaB.Bin006]|nr:MAG: Blue-light-activated protein [Syntrophorhabdus sp. PtaB.Bin006]